MMMWMIFFYMKMASGADYTLVITSVTMEDDAKFQCQVFQNKNGHILPTGQWCAPSAVTNDALIIPEYARACQSMKE